MKTFCTLISRVLLVIFTANCLMPSTAWAQRQSRSKSGKSAPALTAEERAAFLQKLREGDASLLRNEVPVAQRDGVLASEQAQYAYRVKNEIIPTLDKQVDLYEKVQQKVMPDIAKALDSYNLARGRASISVALDQLHRAAVDLVAEQKNLFPSANLVVQMGKTDVVPQQLRISFTQDGEEFLRDLDKKYMTQDPLYNFANLLEVADPVVYPNTHRQSMGYAAQIIAQTAQEWAKSPKNEVALDLLLRAQLRLSRQLGISSFPKPQDKLKENPYDFVTEGTQGLWPTLTKMPEDAQDSSMRGWYRLALLHIHKLYQKWGVRDPLPVDFDKLGQDFLNELAALRNSKLKESEKNFSAFVTLGTLAALYSLAKGGDVTDVVYAIDDNPSSHLTKRTKLKSVYATAAQAVISVLTEQVRYASTPEEASRLSNILLKLTDEKKYSIAVRLAVLEALVGLYNEQSALDWKCSLSHYSKAQAQEKGCHKLKFTKEVRNYLAIKILEIYWPLNATHYASMEDYGLDSSEMKALADELVLLYNSVALERVGQVLNYKTDLNGQVYNDNSTLIIIGKDGFLHHVREDADGYLYTLQGNEQYEKAKVRWFRVYAPYNSPINEKKYGDEMSLEFAKIVGEAVLWAVAFEGVAIAVRTLRGVWLAIPAMVAEGTTSVSQAAGTIKKGIQLSNAVAEAKSAGVTMQALTLTKEGETVPVVIKNYRNLMNLLPERTLMGISYENPSLLKLDVFYGSKHMASLSSEGIAGMSSVKEIDVWRHITKNLVTPGTNVPIGLKALEGSPFRWFNPYLRQVRSDVDLGNAVGRMAKSGEFDLWIGTAPIENRTASGAERIWTNLRESRYQGLELDRIFSPENNFQFAVTPKGSVYTGPSLVADGAFATPFDGAVTPYVTMTKSEGLDLVEDFFGNPKMFGIRDKSALEGFGELQRRYAQLHKGKRMVGNGLWRQAAAETWAQAGEADLLYGHILQSNTPFIQFQANVAVWSGLKAADYGVYSLGYGDWLTRTATKEQTKEMAENFPEYSAAQEAAQKEGNNNQNSSIMDRVSTHARVDTDGAFFGAPIVALRYGFGGSVFALPESTKDFLRSAENNTRLGNAAGFAQIYIPLQSSIAEIKAVGDSNKELAALAVEYETELENIKMSSMPYYEKTQQAKKIQDDWTYDIFLWSSDRDINEFVSVGAFSAAQAADYRRRVKEITGSELGKDQKNLRISALRKEIVDNGNYNYYTKVVPAQVIQAVYPYSQKDFEDIFNRYHQRIGALKANPNATAEDFSNVCDDFIAAVNARIEQLNQDVRRLAELEIEQTLYNENYAY